MSLLHTQPIQVTSPVTLSREKCHNSIMEDGNWAEIVGKLQNELLFDCRPGEKAVKCSPAVIITKSKTTSMQILVNQITSV